MTDPILKKLILLALVGVMLSGCGAAAKKRRLELSSLQTQCLTGNNGACVVYQTKANIDQRITERRARAIRKFGRALQEMSKPQPMVNNTVRMRTTCRRVGYVTRCW